ncbi:uncharacterized protein [Periplaneta americana]|uniref:uncharacterized protein isoform X2 n=1 Tax=Periplaneta americana TaxID=6978 RepID=UPI0037E6FF64
MSEIERKREELAPSWMDKAFFEKALQSSENDSFLTVTSVQFEMATAPGDNYLSVIYRATLQVVKENKTEERFLIVKTQPRGLAMNKIATEGKIFEREIAMLRDVIPAMNRLIEEILPGKCQPFAAKYVYSCNGPHQSTIILEDLKRKGFKMAERTTGLDMDHCILVMRTLARFHAASVALKDRNPEILQPFMTSEVLDVMGKSFKYSFPPMFTNVAEKIKNWPENGERYYNKILNLAPGSAARYVEERKRDENDFNVLSHGDLWINNMMFAYSKDNKCPLDLRFVDYQLSYWTTPAVDIHYFLESSACNDLLNKTHILIEEYYRTLEEILTLFGYQHLLPRQKEFNDQLNKRGVFARDCALVNRRTALVDRNKIPDMNSTSTYMESLKMLLPLFEANGWL